MHCSKCGSSRVYPTPLVYHRGHGTRAAAIGAEGANPFEGNYLNVSRDQKNQLSPLVPRLVPRAVPAASVLAAPPRGASLAEPVVTVAVCLFVAFMIFVGSEHWGRLLGPLCLIPGVVHLAWVLYHNLAGLRGRRRRWEQSTFCVTCGFIATVQDLNNGASGR